MDRLQDKSKAKSEWGEKSLMERLQFNAPIEFVTALSFEACISRIRGIEELSTFFEAYRVQIYPIYKVYGDQMCEFRVRARGTGVEVVGYLRATSEDTTTHVEGQAGVHLIGYLIAGLLGACILAFTYGFNRPVLSWNAAWLCLLLFFPAVAALVWLVDFGQRDQVRQMIEATLERRS
ncbi:MAG: hypothetical protein CL610_15915 [Anaerolineaceae bacterium]|nr:hypothetical protein [Anaerolineaceae bacterium]